MQRIILTRVSRIHPRFVTEPIRGEIDSGLDLMSQQCDHSLFDIIFSCDETPSSTYYSGIPRRRTSRSNAASGRQGTA